MRKHIVLVAGMMLCCSQAGAQVEPRVAGDWKIPEAAGQPAKVLHIGSDGHYQLTSAGQVVDSGRITASEGAVKLQSESGKQEQSRFSMIGGELKMHGGSIDGSWVRNGMSSQSSQSSAVHQFEHSATPSHSPSPGGSFAPTGSSSSQAIPPSKAIWGSVSETHTSTPSTATPGASPSSDSPFSSISAISKSGSTSDTNSNTPASGGSSSTTNSSGPTSAGPPASAQGGQQSSQLKSTGSKIFNFVKNNFNAATDAASSFSPGTTQTNGYSNSSAQNAQNNYGGYGASNQSRANAFITPSAAQRYYGSGGMPKRSTSAGIPVMKDGTARKIRFGR